MIILELEQNTQEWLDIRRQHIGASDCPIIMDKSPFKGPHALWREKTLNEKGFVSQAMMRGSKLEPEALKEYNRKYGTIFSPTVAKHDDIPYMLASFDGYDPFYRYTLEIKCPTKIQDWEKEFPESWEWQAQHQMCVSGFNQVRFVIYHPDQKELTIIDIERDNEKISKLLQKEEEFHKCMIFFQEPKRGKNEKEYISREDEEWERIAEKYNKAIALENEGKRLKEESKMEAVNLSNGTPTKGCGITLCINKGRKIVDYKNIPEFQGIDLDTYTKTSAPSWKIMTYRRKIF